MLGVVESISQAGNGIFISSGFPKFRMYVDVTKEGYYKSETDRLSRTKDHGVQLVLREKKNPIPLSAKRWRIITEERNKAIGFDFAVGDWVEPDGKGLRSDVFFKIAYNQIDFWSFSYRLDISFPNEFDGIQTFKTVENSKLKSPYQAPLDGYEKNWTHLISRSGKNEARQDNGSLDRNYWMRVRSEVDDQGRLVSANYVKIYGNFPDLHYYFNPTPNDRNLEFDPAQNLLKGLDSMERPDLP